MLNKIRNPRGGRGFVVVRYKHGLQIRAIGFKIFLV